MKKVIIIGASSGIGKGLATMYALDGCIVGITGRRKELLESFQQDYPENIIIECFDVTGPDILDDFKSLLQQTGGMDLLIYSSGFGDVSETLDWAIDKQTILTNVNGFTEIVNHSFNYFAAQGSGQIVSISSIASIRGNSYAPAYSASKAFISNYMEGLHMKAYKQKLNITITDILPGFVKTKMAKGNKQFWVAPLDKACEQIYASINQKKRRAYITSRWWLIAKIMANMPYFIFKRFS